MNYRLTAWLLLTTFAGILCGCHSDEFVARTFQASFKEQFVAACGDQPSCRQAVETYGDGCFDPNLAIETFKAAQPKKRQLNSTHILAFQACIAQKARTDYWAGMDMPAIMLDKGGS